MKARYRIPLSAALAVFMVGAVCLKTGIYFETNDDRLIAEILAGVIGGEPSAHTVYVNYLLSFPLSCLYRLTTEVPWYGICLIFFRLLSFFLILDSVLGRCRGRIQTILATGVTAAFFLLNIYTVGMIQYTSAAAMLAASGYVCLLLCQNRRKGLFLFAAASALAFLLRSDAMLMIQPMGMAVYAGTVLMERGASGKQRVLRVMQAGVVIAAVFLAGEGSNALAYRGEGWKKYNSFNDANVYLFDYYGKPPYDEVTDILSKHGVTKAEYEAYVNYVIPDWDISPECAWELAEYAAQHSKGKSVLEVLQDFFGRLWKDDNWQLSRIAVLLCIAAAICIVLFGKYHLLIPLAFLESAKIILWTYLLYRGRTPMRITFPLLLCEIALLLVLIMNAALETTRVKKWKSAVLLGVCGIFCFLCFLSGRQQYRYVEQENRGMKIFMQGFAEIEEYCRQRPENKYLWDAYSLSYYKGSALDGKTYGKRNGMVTGSWYANSPVALEAMKQYLKPDGRGIYLIVAEDGRGEAHPALVYLEEKTASEALLEDRFTASHGGEYLVYCFEGDFLFGK